MPRSWPVIIFLDIDGVLNGHEFLAEAKSNKIDRECVKHLNRIIKETDARVVLSSAWRYMVHGHAMTLGGFGYMLRTHGFIGSINGCEDIIIDLTCRDEDIPERPDQIRAWLRSQGMKSGQAYLVIDDLDLDWGNLEVLQTDGASGLTALDADLAIMTLSRQIEAIDNSETPDMALLDVYDQRWRTRYRFFCPGCAGPHVIEQRKDGGEPSWLFSGNLDKPTFMPSVKVQGAIRPSTDSDPGLYGTCHLFIANGQIQYLSDCTHGLAGQTVDMVPIRPLETRHLGTEGA